MKKVVASEWGIKGLVTVVLLISCLTLGFRRVDLDEKIEGAAFTRYVDGKIRLADLWLAVVRLTVVAPGHDLKWATGFFFWHDSRLYLITNRHVVISEKDDYYADELILKIHNNSNDLSKNKYLYLKLRGEGGENLWLEHPSYSSDVDVIALSLSGTFTNGDYLIGAFEEEDFHNEDDNFAAGEDVVVIGYPFGIADDRWNLPIIRQGTVASGYPIYFEGKPFFYIDTRLHKGSSGSPVLAKPGELRIVRGKGTDTSTRGKIYLLGVNSGHMELEEKIRELYYDEDEPFRTLDLSRVWYAELIIAIIEQKSK